MNNGYTDYYKELCPSEESWVHRQLSDEREELEDEIVKLRAEVERLSSEVGMLRGVDCGAIQETEEGPKSDGECGVCIKCLRARAERAEAELEEARKDSKRYRYLAWKSDTNPIMIIKLNDNTLLFGYDADETIDAAIKDGG